MVRLICRSSTLIYPVIIERSSSPIYPVIIWRSSTLIYPVVIERSSIPIYPVITITMLPKFEGEAALKDSTFWWVVYLTHKVSWSVYSLRTIWLAWLYIWFGISNTRGGLWSNGVGQNIETDDEHDEVCGGEGFTWLG